MKRIIISLILVFSFIICLPACSLLSGNAEIYEKFNNFSSNVNKYTIEIQVTSPNGNMVNETYQVIVEGTTRTVNYLIEKINTITVDGNNITVPEDYIDVTEGTAQETVGSQDAYALPTFKFSDLALKNFERDTTSFPYKFSADVISTKSFMGVDLDANDITLTGAYLVTNFSYITLSYTTENGNTVTVTYTYN